MTTVLRYALIIAVQIPLGAFLLMPGVLSRYAVLGEPWPNFSYAWNVILAAVIADVAVCSLVGLVNRRNVRRLCVSVACSIPAVLAFVVLAPNLTAIGNVDSRMVMLLVVSCGAILGWLLGGFINEQIEKRQPFHLTRIQFTLGELMMAMFLVACVAGLVSLVISLRSG